MPRPVSPPTPPLPDLAAVDRRDAQLWVLGGVLLVAFAAGFILLGLSSDDGDAARAWERRALVGQSLLLLLTFAYFCQRRRELRRARRSHIHQMLESERLRERNEALGATLQAITRLGRLSDERRIAEEIRDATLTSLRADRCVVILRDERTGEALRVDSDPEHPVDALVERADAIVATGAALLKTPDNGSGRTVIGAPILLRRRIGGAIVAELGRNGHRLGDWDTQLVEIIARVTAATIENTRLAARLTHRRDQLRRSLHRLRLAQPGVILGERLKAMEELVDRVAHFIANPLTTISGYAQVLGNENLDATTRASLATIEQEVDRCHRALNDLKAFAHRPPAEPRSTDMQQLIRQALSLKANRFNRIHLDVAFRPHDALGEAVVDPVQLQQVFFSVLADIESAIADVPPHTLVIETDERDARLRIHFHLAPLDPAGRPETLPWVPFSYDGEDDEAAQFARGIVNAVVRAHGGTTRTRLNAERGTTRFTVELPHVATRPPSPTTAAPGTLMHEPAPTTESKPRALVVDDEERIVRLIERVLANEGFEVIGIDDGARALEVLRTDDFDVIVLDYHLPRMQGTELADFLVAERPALAARVVLATGDDQAPDFLAAAQRLGAPTLAKPFQIRAMIDTVRSVMGASPSTV